MRILIVDDEPLARTALEKVCRERKDVDGYDMAPDAIKAMELLRSQQYDIVLLDINMPEVSGLQLADSLRKNGLLLPSIVFVTAYDKHAVAAFEKQAVDYVLKPFSHDRIGEAIDRAFRRTAAERARLINTQWPQYLSQPSNQNRVAIKAKGRILLIDPAEIIAIEAEGNYVMLRRESGADLLRESISTVANKLKSYGLIRIHRSVLVNASYVEEIQPWSTGEYLLRVKGGRKYMASRTYKKNLSALAEHWLGLSTKVDSRSSPTK